MYQALKFNPNIPPQVKRVIQHLDMLLKDVHAMMRLPLRKEEGLDAGCNFAAAVFLLEIIGGISTTLYQSPGGSGQKFKGLLENYYPWDIEGITDKTKASNELYKWLRNPLAHALGIGGKGGIGKQGFPEDLLEKLELSTSPPPNKTLQSISAADMLHLSVDSLYWGMRIMISRLTDDAVMMNKAESFLSKVLPP